MGDIDTIVRIGLVMLAVTLLLAGCSMLAVFLTARSAMGFRA